MSQLAPKKDMKPKSKENETKIDKFLAQDFKKDLSTPKKDHPGLLTSNLNPPPKKQEKQTITLAQIIQNAKSDGHRSSGMSETHSSKFFMYGNNITQSKSKDRLIHSNPSTSKDYKHTHGLKTSEIRPNKNPPLPIGDKNAKRMTMFFSKELATPTDRSHSKGPPTHVSENIDHGAVHIQRPPKRRQTDILDPSTKISTHNYGRAVTKEENKNGDHGYNLSTSEKNKVKISTSSTLTKVRDPSPSSNYNKPESMFSSKKKTSPKEDILILFDHDLNFLKAEISKMITLPYTEEKLEDFNTADPELARNAFKVLKAKMIFVFLKFSPRVKEKSLTISNDLVKLKKTYIIKCIPDNEDVDPNLQFDKLTLEEKKQIEHTFVLTKENFDSYNLAPEHLFELKIFLNSKIAP